ncbi:RIP metalloprotease RseP [Kordia algicida OT-1]|uniref:Zinc metalloprotease n=1 Tax=Kordia algicida OT-1 TaxID=391587 RepID=A9DNB8_9FLAO|nr:RIP metalloprotease RseP [Kordia algicida]EDP97155.1 membrane-associated zinc metalloprotease [Kordia algicida OT-1]
MGLFIQITTFVLIISILVILHELGHFIPAKLFKTKVEKFYLFFDPWFSIVKKKIGDTVYGIGWLPLGGYVKIAGMIDESMDKEQMEKPPQPWEFRSKPAWQRLIIMLGGVIVNFLLAWVIYISMFMYYGETYIPVDQIKDGLYVDEISEQIGLRTGDKILKIDGNKVEKLDKYLTIDILLGDEATVLRNGKEETVTLSDEGKKAALDSKGRNFVTPRYRSLVIGKVVDTLNAKQSGIKVGDELVSINNNKLVFWDEFVESLDKNKGNSVDLVVKRDGQLVNLNAKLDTKEPFGVFNNRQLALKDLFVTREYGFLEAVPRGFEETINVLVRQVKQFKLIFNPVIQGYKKVKGPIGIVEMMSPVWDWQFFWGFMAMFSVWLAFLNILPIPALDGGHVMFLLYEIIVGKAPSQKVMEIGQIIGFVIIMSLMVVIFGNDIWNLIKGGS